MVCHVETLKSLVQFQKQCISAVFSLSLSQNENTLHLTQRYFQAGQLQNLASSAVLSLTVLEVLLLLLISWYWEKQFTDRKKKIKNSIHYQNYKKN